MPRMNHGAAHRLFFASRRLHSAIFCSKLFDSGKESLLLMPKYLIPERRNLRWQSCLKHHPIFI